MCDDYSIVQWIRRVKPYKCRFRFSSLDMRIIGFSNFSLGNLLNRFAYNLNSYPIFCILRLEICFRSGMLYLNIRTTEQTVGWWRELPFHFGHWENWTTITIQCTIQWYKCSSPCSEYSIHWECLVRLNRFMVL